MTEGREHIVAGIADDGFVGDADAEEIEFGGEVEGIGVLAERRQQFGADGNDLCFHRKLLYSMGSGGASATRAAVNFEECAAARISR